VVLFSGILALFELHTIGRWTTWLLILKIGNKYKEPDENALTS
jgi:hypothetical protein